MRLDGLHLALAGGITLGFGIAFATFIAFYSGNGVELLNLFTFYPGYEVSVAGAGVGFLWGFLEGFFAMVFFAWVYNHIHRYHE
jgi:hypothetical protein